MEPRGETHFCVFHANKESLVLEAQHLRIIFEVLDLHLGCLVLEAHFPRTCSKNIDFLGLGADRHSEPDEADEGKMVHARQFRP